MPAAPVADEFPTCGLLAQLACHGFQDARPLPPPPGPQPTKMKTWWETLQQEQSNVKKA